MNLQLERIELREIELPLKWPFETSFGRTTRRRILIVRAFIMTGFRVWRMRRGRKPIFNHETIDTAWLLRPGCRPFLSGGPGRAPRR